MSIWSDIIEFLYFRISGSNFITTKDCANASFVENQKAIPDLIIQYDQDTLQIINDLKV